MLASTLGKWLWSWRCQLAYLTPENWRWYLRLSSSSSTPQGGLRLCALCPRAKTAKDYWLVMRLGCQCVIICVAEANSAEERYTNTSTFLSHVVIAHGFPVSNGFGRNLRFLSHSAATVGETAKSMNIMKRRGAHERIHLTELEQTRQNVNGFAQQSIGSKYQSRQLPLSLSVSFSFYDFDLAFYAQCLVLQAQMRSKSSTLCHTDILSAKQCKPWWGLFKRLI